MRGNRGEGGISVNEYSCAHGVQIKFEDLTCNLWNKSMLRPLKYIELKTTTPSSFFAVGGGGGWGVCTTPDATAWSEL
jgi:hypothetical protein